MFRTNRSAFGSAWITLGVRCLVLLTLLRSDSNVVAGKPAVDARSQVTFCAMGDVPSVPAEDVLLPKQIAEFQKSADLRRHIIVERA